MSQEHSPTSQKQEYFVDNEPQPLVDKELSVREILRRAGDLPPESFFLVEYRGEGQQVEHKDLDEIIKLHNMERFAAMYNGPTPVS